MATPDALLKLIRQEACRPVPPAVQALADRIRATFGDAAAAILFYGSCLRSGDDRGGMVDLYVLVDSYRAAYPSRVPGAAQPAPAAECLLPRSPP